MKVWWLESSEILGLKSVGNHIIFWRNQQWMVTITDFKFVTIYEKFRPNISLIKTFSNYDNLIK